MDQPDRGAERHFAQPYRQFLTMFSVLALVAAGAYVAYPQVAPVFLANPLLNGFIGFVFVIGVLACFWQVFQLVSSVSWIEGFAHDRPGHQFTKAPRLVASLAALLRKKGARSQLGASSSRSILDSVATRIDEARDITRYIVNLLIFLGLLGTFYGLATTVPAVVDTIRSLAPEEGDSGMVVFERLMAGLEDQLEGMGIAFASSLLGLAGSLVVGLLELFASHGQNRFYRELEEWLSTITRVGFTSDEGTGGDTSALAQLAEHMAERLDQMQEFYAQSADRRDAANDQMGQLAEAVGALSSQIGGGSNGEMARLADSQERLTTALEGMAGEGAGNFDPESRMRLRSMDVQMLRILEEISAGRQESIGELRADIAQLTKAVRLMGRRDTGGL
ncbi:MAG: biopolymer transporter ExbB [Silicimonas sp.]|nr:biopolymer transporter ExbB [Silicimonas sp.]